MTPEQWQAIRGELVETVGVRQKVGEDEVSFARRLAIKANESKDDTWNSLTEDSQVWCNKAIEAIEDKVEGGSMKFPLPDRYLTEDADEGEDEEEAAEAAPEDEEEAPAEEEEPEEEEETTVASSEGKKSAAAGKAAAVKSKSKAKAKAAEAPKPKASKAGSPGRPGRYPMDAKVHILVDGNPHRESSKDHQTFKKIREGATIADLRKAGVNTGYINYIADRAIIEIVT